MQSTHAIALSAAMFALLSAGVASAGTSSASGLSANFSTGGVNTVLSLVNPLSSAGIKLNNFDKAISAGTYQNQLVLTDKGSNPPTLTVNVATLKSHIKGAFGVDTLSDQGDATDTSVDLRLAPYTPPGSDFILPPFLRITATKLQETANYFYQAPGFANVSTASTITKLTVTGSLLGNKTLTFTGAPAANKVLYQAGGLTITLNQKMVAGLISCSLKCQFTPYSVTAAAIDVNLNGVKLGSQTVSGDIFLASGSAGQGS